MTKNQKTNLLWLTSVLCFIFFILASFGYVNPLAVKANAVDAQAYVVNEDRGTRGGWYTGENGKKENAETRNYGKSGAVLLYHWSYLDGQMYKNVSDINDLRDNSSKQEPHNKPHYVEYPSWVSEITGDLSFGDNPTGYWNNEQRTLEEAVHQSNYNNEYCAKWLLPMNPETQNMMHSGAQFSRDDMNFTVNVTDDAWHVVTVYIGNTYNGMTSIYAETDLQIYDLQGNLICEYTAKDVNKGVYVSFAVKGSYKLRIDNGISPNCCLSGIFFDEYIENTEIGTNNFHITRSGAKTINLVWENLSNDSFTNIYRKEKNAAISEWQIVATTSSGVNSYTDSTVNVSTTYEYMLSSGVKRANCENYYGLKNQPQVFDFNIPDESKKMEIATAQYTPTHIELTEFGYFAQIGEKIEIGAILTKANENGVDYEPYANIEVRFTIYSEKLYTNVTGTTESNVNVNIGNAVTDANGMAKIEWTPEFADEMRIRAEIDLQPNPDNEEEGMDACVNEVPLSVVEKKENCVPHIFTISEEVKPGETITITGNYLAPDERFLVAYAPTCGVVKAEFDEQDKPRGVRYLTVSDMAVTDSIYGNGISFTFPETAKAGVYDFWIRNAYGWSKSVTVNAPKALYIDQDGAYEGMPIQIVGRNFYTSEFGVGTAEDAIHNLSVKLVRIGDDKGVFDGKGETVILNTANGGISTGIKYVAQDSATGETIYDTNPYKITIKTPKVYYYGTYEVFVSNDGINYYGLEEYQQLVIYPKKAQNWDTTVFGTISETAHIGNDPLDLKKYWAQDLNYTNVRTMTPNGKPSAGDLAEVREETESVELMTSNIQQAIDELHRQGGGVVYFPEGEYSFSSVRLYEKVLLVGAGADKTIFYSVTSGKKSDEGAVFIKAIYEIGKTSNLGVARVSIKPLEEDKNANTYILFKEQDSNRVFDCYSENVFVIDVNMDLDEEMPKNITLNNLGSAGSIQIEVNNAVVKNVHVQGGAFLYLHIDKYVTVENVYQKLAKNSAGTPELQARYSIIENCVFDMNHQESHGPSIRSATYIAFCFTTGTGDRTNPTNDGEALLMEAAGTINLHGRVIQATERTITVDFTSGSQKLTENSPITYDRFAVYIIEGKGAGQIRYIEQTPINAYGTCYQFMEGERDWDVIPDSTSVFGISCTVNNTTVYKYKAKDCKASVCVYFTGWNVLVKDCTLIDTGGITLTGLTQGFKASSQIHVLANVRIEDNNIYGVSPHYNEGITAGDMSGGIVIQVLREGSDGYIGSALWNVIVRGNNLYDLVPEEQADMKWKAGIVVYTNGVKEGQGVSGDGKYLVIENNYVKNSQWGVYCENRITGIVVRNNTLLDITDAEPLLIYSPDGLYVTSNHKLYVGETESGYSGEYVTGSFLPKAISNDGKKFIGWSSTQDYQPGDMITNNALGYNTTLYAVFGYEVLFDLNYDKNGGSTFNTVVVFDGENVKTSVEDYGDPFRRGYTFGGWYQDKECTVLFNAQEAVTENKTVYAKWLSKTTEEQPPIVENNNNIAVIIGVASGAVLIVACSVVAIILIKKRKGEKR